MLVVVVVKVVSVVVVVVLEARHWFRSKQALVLTGARALLRVRSIGIQFRVVLCEDR